MNPQAQMRAALPHFFQHLMLLVAEATNVGDTGDDKDLYVLLDSAIEATAQSHPDFLCEGCPRYCCWGSTGLPLTTAIEWRAVHRSLLQLPEAIQRQVMRQTYEHFGSFLESLLPERLKDNPVVPPTVHCPFLVHNRCAIPDGQPLLCRGYGHFLWQRDAERSVPYMCDPAVMHVQTRFPPDMTLPFFNAYHDRLGAIAGEAPVTALLPVWIAAHAEGTRFISETQAAPDFKAAVQRFLSTMRNRKSDAHV